MPSYRVSVGVGALRSGVDPAAILPSLRDALAELTTVEAADLGVASGEARITIRFLAEDAALAWQLADAVRARLAEFAVPGSLTLRTGSGRDWRSVPRD